MLITGRCYCGDLKYEVEGEPQFTAQCHCRECQYLTGGAPNIFMVMPKNTFQYNEGKAKGFARSDLDNPVTREFCSNCGTHILTKSNSMPDAVIIKVGSMDDLTLFEGPQMAIFCEDKQAFHTVPEGVPEYDKFPG